MEEGYDEELEKLLGEIPRATSAPPHFEELQIARKDHDHPSSEHLRQVDVSSEEVSVSQTLRHGPSLYPPFSKPSRTSPLIGALAYEDLPLSGKPVSPFYVGLTPAGYPITNIDKQGNSQSWHPVDLGLIRKDGVSQNLTAHVSFSGRHMFPVRCNGMKSLTLQDESQNYAGNCEVKTSVSSSDECDTAFKEDVLQSESQAVCSASCLPPATQLLDPLTHSGSECFETKVSSDSDKLTLEDERLAQSQEKRFVHGLRSSLQIHCAKQPSDQSFLMSSNLSGASPMHFGHSKPVTNGAVFSICPPSFMAPHPYNMRMTYTPQIHDTATQQQVEERVLCRQRVKEEFLLRQQRLQEQQAQFYASLQSQPGLAYCRHQSGMQHSHAIQTPSCVFDVIPPTLKSKTIFSSGMKPERNSATEGIGASPVVEEGHKTSGACGYFLRGFCPKGDLCPFPHTCMMNNSISTSNAFLLSEAAATPKGPRNGLCVAMAGFPAMKKNYPANGLASSHSLSNGTHLASSHPLSSARGGGSWKEMDSIVLQNVDSQHVMQHSSLPPRYTTLEEVEGHIYAIAKDQHGCRFLQRKFEEGVAEDVQKIFEEIIGHVVELMTDPFGNYLIQKLLDVCNETQRMEIVYKVTAKDQLVTISLNMHGTRAVQKLIETLSSTEQVRLVVTSLRQGVVMLIKDLNGNHVVQRCLQHLSAEESQFIFDAAASHCVDIATHRHGCCVLQRCVDFSSGQQRNRLVAEIAANSLMLSQDPFGNYVVQYILDLGLTWAIAEVITHLDGNFVHLAMQKFSSNVVEKCLKLSGEENKSQIINELLTSARLAQLLQDPFANYVVQSALTVSKGGLHFQLVEAIRPHLPALRSSPYGKRILSRTSLKK